MMSLVRLALRRPYTVAVLSLLVLLLGILAVWRTMTAFLPAEARKNPVVAAIADASRMNVDFFPKIDIPVVFVGWNYPGLSAEEMERRVVIISERAYSTTVSGIERIESTCIPGIGLVNALYLAGGIRAVELGSVMFGKPAPDGDGEVAAPHELVRLAFPRRVYTQSHFDYLIETLDVVWRQRASIKAYRITEQAPFLRHFTAHYKPADVCERLLRS